MARIAVRGTRLYAGSKPWRAWGMNWGIGDHYPVIDYFDNPTPARLALLTCSYAQPTPRRHGLRIYLELGQVMQTPSRARISTLAALRKLLKVAERERIYLDITGNLLWRPKRTPGWYDRLPERSRWHVQANSGGPLPIRRPALLPSSATS